MPQIYTYGYVNCLRVSSQCLKRMGQCSCHRRSTSKLGLIVGVSVQCLKRMGQCLCHRRSTSKLGLIVGVSVQCLKRMGRGLCATGVPHQRLPDSRGAGLPGRSATDSCRC